jgi:hypothetical protein
MLSIGRKVNFRLNIGSNGAYSNYKEILFRQELDQPWEIVIMESLKQEALNVISKMPDTAEIDDIMYRLYVIDKVRKGREAVQRGEVLSVEDLKKEIGSW